MSNRNILFIVEGDDDAAFVKQFCKTCFQSDTPTPYAYCTDIHALCYEIYDEVCELGDNFDIQQHLRACERNKDNEILRKKFTDIIIVFDLDPQNKKRRFAELNKLLEFFNDSTNNGRLYINYPMLESYRHLRSMPDPDFETRTIAESELKNYKQIVDRDSIFKDLRKYDEKLFFNISSHHLSKCQKILNKYDLITATDLEKLYDVQVEKITNETKLWVLNTTVLHLYEYNPTEFERKLKPDKKK